ncbi:MAG: CHASE sensor domain-containing protein, partial [Terriglobales bacterium]
MARSQSITNRLIRMNMLVSAVAVVLACAAFFFYDAHNFRRQALNQLSVQARVIAYEGASPLIFHDARSAHASLAALRGSPHITAAAIYDGTGALFAGYKEAPQRLAPPFRAQATAVGAGVTLQGFRVVQPIRFQGQLLGAVFIRSDAGVLGSEIRGYLGILAIILAGSLLIAYMLARGTQQRIASPIVELAKTAHAIARDNNYTLRAEALPTPDEIGLLVGAFNTMLGEIQQRDASLQASEQRFRTLADTIPQLAWMSDAEGATLWFNQRWYN